MELEKLICSYRATIRETMVCIESNFKGIAFLSDDSCRLVGVMTDGDIRRLLINGCGMNDSVQKYMRREFVYATVKILQRNLTAE